MTDRQRPAAGEPNVVVTETVTGARVVTVTGPVDRDLTRRLRSEVEALFRRSSRPVVVDLLRTPGSELAVVAALRHVPPCTAPPFHHEGVGPEFNGRGDDRTAHNAVRLRVVIDPTAAEAWMAIDHSRYAVYPTLSAALEPRN